MLKLQSTEDAYDLLRQLGAHERLLVHVQLVGEAAELLLRAYRGLQVEVDETLIRVGVALHDAGKTLHTQEVFVSGHLHEEAGEKLLLGHDVDPAVARCCLAHAQWRKMDCSLEELTVALADNLWKGKRVPDLDAEAIAQVAQRLNRDRWDLEPDLEALFTAIANQGDERLARSHRPLLS